MKICIQQPQYLPYIGFFHKLMLSDVCVILDDVKYSKNDFFNRNKIKTAQGWCWLTVPVKASADHLIKDAEIDNTHNWRGKHFKTILLNYMKSPFFERHKDFFEEYYKKKWVNLTELNLSSLKYISEQLKIPIKFIRSSGLGITTAKTQKLVDICKMLKADTYISGIGAKDYMDDKLFETNGIKLLYQDFRHPVYEQRFEKFEKFMSIIDLIFNHGLKSAGIIRNSGGVFQ